MTMEPPAMVREIAVARLASAPKSPEVIATLAKAMRDPDATVGEAAVFALEVLRPGNAGALFAAAYREAPRKRIGTDMVLQRPLLFALTDVGGPDVLPVLKEAMDDSGEGDETPDGLPKWGAEAIYTMLGKESAPVFREKIASEHPMARRLSALYLGTLQDAEAAPLLKKASKDLDPGVALAAGRGLILCGDDEGFQALALGMHHADRAIRGEAVDTLTILGVRSIPTVLELAKDADPKVRANSMILLARIGDASVLPALETMNEDADPKVREFAARAIAEIKARTGATGK